MRLKESSSVFRIADAPFSESAQTDSPVCLTAPANRPCQPMVKPKETVSIMLRRRAVLATVGRSFLQGCQELETQVTRQVERRGS